MDSGNGVVNLGKGTRVYDFDTPEECQVKLGGRTFTVTEQHEPAIVEVLAAFGRDDDATPEGEEAPTPPLAERVRKQWTDAYPVFATMLGYWEPGGEREDVIGHLRKWLRVRPGQEIVKLWWEVNNIDDFLACAGTFLVDPKISEQIIGDRRSQMVRAAIQMIEGGRDVEPVAEN